MTSPRSAAFLRNPSTSDVRVDVYQYPRPGELWVLEWSDVDLKDQVIHITKAWDFKNKKTKSTKTHETRTVPIEPNLLPLLKRMHTRADGKGLVVPVLSASNPDLVAKITREHFEAAGCKRPRLLRPRRRGAARAVPIRGATRASRGPSSAAMMS